MLNSELDEAVKLLEKLISNHTLVNQSTVPAKYKDTYCRALSQAIEFVRKQRGYNAAS